MNKIFCILSLAITANGCWADDYWAAKDHSDMGEWRTAIMHYQVAAYQGDIRAKSELGMYYLREVGGLANNPHKALRLLSEAANAGNSKACFQLSRLYQHGLYDISANTRLAEDYQRRWSLYQAHNTGHTPLLASSFD